MRLNLTATAMLAASASLMLAACGSDSGSADADGDGEITAEEVAAEIANGPAVQMRPGQWEQTFEFTDVEMPDMPQELRDGMSGAMGRTFTTTVCMSEEDVADPDPEMFSGEMNDDCTYDRFDRSGNRMELTMTCDSGAGGASTMVMEGEFGEEEYSFQMSNMVSGSPMGDMTMSGTMSARRIGDC